MFRGIIPEFLIVAAPGLAASAGQITYRRIAFTELTPTVLTEFSPLNFYSFGALNYAFSITPQGQQAPLAGFQGSSLGYPFVMGANSRAYTTQGGSVVSIGSGPGTKKVYPVQSIGATLFQNLPDGTLLGYGASGTTMYLVKSDLQGNITSFAQFPAGQGPWNVLYATDGNYYGVAHQSGPDYVYRGTPSGTMTTLYTGISGDLYAFF